MKYKNHMNFTWFTKNFHNSHKTNINLFGFLKKIFRIIKWNWPYELWQCQIFYCSTPKIFWISSLKYKNWLNFTWYTKNYHNSHRTNKNLFGFLENSLLIEEAYLHVGLDVWKTLHISTSILFLCSINGPI